MSIPRFSSVFLLLPFKLTLATLFWHVELHLVLFHIDGTSCLQSFFLLTLLGLCCWDFWLRVAYGNVFWRNFGFRLFLRNLYFHFHFPIIAGPPVVFIFLWNFFLYFRGLRGCVFFLDLRCLRLRGYVFFFYLR